MGLAEAIDDYCGRPSGRIRELDKIIARLDERDRAALETSLANPSVPGSAIGAALRSEGHQISDSAIYSYRREVMGA